MSPIVSPRAREDSRRPVLRVLRSGQSAEAGVADIGMTMPESPRPSLRIVPDDDHPHLRPLAPVLLAGGDRHGRATLREEFGATLPPRTGWVEAEDITGVLQRASYSRMVILAGDLHDADADSLMRLLGQRHPELPVICVDAPLPAVAGGRG